MANPINLNLNYEEPIKIADNIYWVGFYDEESGLHCNPYLIVDGDEAVLIDGGSRPDFPTVMTKILKTGTNPSDIRGLIYHHYDPDLCGSVSDYEDIIERKDLRIMSTVEKSRNGSGAFYGETRLHEILEANKTLPIEALLTRAHDDMVAFGEQAHPPTDDITMLGVEFL